MADLYAAAAGQSKTGLPQRDTRLSDEPGRQGVIVK
jgi:hypothetical protein